MPKTPYIGRFAPSPSGPLHIGSLVCALASYLDAKHQHGTWLVRIEDIDPPREQAGATNTILESLKQHGLHWDGDITQQSTRSERYLNVLSDLQEKHLSYRCDCTRKRLANLSVAYDDHCRERNIDHQNPTSVRLNNALAAQKLNLSALQHINDRIQPSITENLLNEGDFVIHRKDGLFAYQLAVVVDDIEQGITDIVRGADLYDCSAKQQFLAQTLNAHAFNYAHIPVVCHPNGDKLSKQNHAPRINDIRAQENLNLALKYLQQSPPDTLNEAPIETILQWGIEHWNINALSNQNTITL
ncbi:MAG: tRNA glutamyl-Q(34) synthetase GluQRS [Agarilytica sp.]